MPFFSRLLHDWMNPPPPRRCGVADGRIVRYTTSHFTIPGGLPLQVWRSGTGTSFRSGGVAGQA